MLAAVIALSIFGGSIKGFRAVFLQIKESPYVEAAQAYGASNSRIIMQYLVPRIVPLLIPQLVILIPSNVFLEATLNLLGLGDPVLPTWGKLIQEGIRNGALVQGQFYWVMQPSFILLITGLAFAMVGFSMDRIFNPRLRGL
jgi:peptide/nickel transport system permease protein